MPTVCEFGLFVLIIQGNKEVALPAQEFNNNVFANVLLFSSP